MSKPLLENDPCLFMLADDVVSTPTVYKKGCYICDDPEFAEMGLPLCYPCFVCGGHVRADDCVCGDCGRDQREQERDEQ